jgi:hypothetical protein
MARPMFPALALCAAFVVSHAEVSARQTGVLLLAHGGATEWNERVKAVAAAVVAVPLFVSSWNSVIRSTEYLLGLRDTAPADLKLFARMGHHSMHGVANASMASTTGWPARR